MFRPAGAVFGNEPRCGLCVFLRTLNETVEKILLGFAAGVMVAASVWSLLLPAIDGAAALGRLAFLPAAGGFAVGFALLLLLDRYLPEPAITGGGGAKTGMMALAITLHNIPEGMAVGAAFAGVLSGNGGGAAAAALAAGIAIQNIPEGAIISLPLAGCGMKKAPGLCRGRWLRRGGAGGRGGDAGSDRAAAAAAALVPGLCRGGDAFCGGRPAAARNRRAQKRSGRGGLCRRLSVMMVLDVALG